MNLLTVLRYRMGLVKPPTWYPAWVRDNPDLSMDGVASGEIADKKENWDILIRAKTRIDRKGLYRPDLGDDRCIGFQPVPEGSDKGKPSGDCEDFAFEYMKGLLKAGMPRGVLRFAMCRTERGAWHAVLAVVIAGKPPLILDNRFRERLWLKTLGPMLLCDYWAWESPGRSYWWEPMP